MGSSSSRCSSSSSSLSSMPGALECEVDDGFGSSSSSASARNDALDVISEHCDERNQKSKTPGLISLAGLSAPSLSSSASTPTSSSSTLVTPPPAMMSDIEFHSPNDQIVGTPFATSNTPFEYPFPSEGTSISASTSTSSCSSLASHFSSPTSSTNSFAPPSPPHMPSTHLPNGSAIHHPHPYHGQALPAGATAADFPLPPPGGITLTHPKMRATPPPMPIPIPPSLLKKQQEKNRARRSVDVSGSFEGMRAEGEGKTGSGKAS